jgi:hypothetical protein
MAEWLGDHRATIGSLNLDFALINGLWLNWTPGRALRWKLKTVGWEARGEVCGKSAP